MALLKPGGALIYSTCSVVPGARFGTAPLFHDMLTFAQPTLGLDDRRCRPPISSHILLAALKSQRST